MVNKVIHYYYYYCCVLKAKNSCSFVLYYRDPLRSLSYARHFAAMVEIVMNAV